MHYNALLPTASRCALFVCVDLNTHVVSLARHTTGRGWTCKVERDRLHELRAAETAAAAAGTMQVLEEEFGALDVQVEIDKMKVESGATHAEESALSQQANMTAKAVQPGRKGKKKNKKKKK